MRVHRSRRAGTRGAIAILSLTLASLVLAIGLVIAIRLAANLATTRAQVIADSAAHAAVGFLAASPLRDALSREMQMSYGCAYDASKHLALSDDGAGGDDASNATVLCHVAFAVVQDIIRRNDPHATLETFDLATDSRDYVSSGGATRLVAWVNVRVNGPLAPYAALCGHDPVAGLCYAEAASAARESG